MARYWLPHQEHVWAVGKVTLEEADKLTFLVDNGRDGEVISLPASKLSTLAAVQHDQEQGLEDICNLTNVSEAALLNTVRTRYLQNCIYTRSMRILIAVNPFQDLPIYSTQHIDQYMAASDSLELPPHVFGIGRDALRGLQNTEKAQAILISGESGAGKTESAKLILSFVAESVRTSGASAAGIEERVLQTNPILEAFGNAMTVRNNNSSRFGKWLDLLFCDVTELSGCALTSYLLETTRVCSQARNERGYHIFFQLLQARKNPPFSSLGLDEPKTYRYLKDGQMNAPGVDDKSNFEELQDALTALNFDEEIQKEVFSVVGGVLTLGNCEFQADGDASKLVTAAPANKSAELLGVDTSVMTKCLLIKKMVIGSDVTETPLRIEQARAVRDGLARLLYGRMFLWIISRINMTLMSGAGGDAKSLPEAQLLGVLDIAGFENFDINSLEQLMINLSNEHLQQNFNRVIIKEEMEDCIREGVTTPDIGNFSDNADCLALLDAKGGILDLLDETMVVPKATDMTYVTKVIKQQGEHKRFIGTKVARLGFGIHHFAGDVTYTCEGWLEKNSDRPPDNAAELLASSSLEPLQEIGKSMISEVEAAKGAVRGKARKAKSVSALFRESLKSLIEKVSAADPHYIRCVKPNKEKIPGRFSAQMVMEQLLLGGVLATVKIRQQGYAYRMPKPRFANQYRCVFKQLGISTSKSAPDALADSIMDVLPKLLPSSGVRKDAAAIGKSKVFMTMEVFKALEHSRQQALFYDAVSLQRRLRGFVARRRIAEQKELRQELVAWQARVPGESAPPSGTFGRQRSLSQWSGDAILLRVGSTEAVQGLLTELEPLMRKAQIIAFKNGDVFLAERTKKRMLLELEAVSEVEELCNSLDVVTVEKATARLRGLGLSQLEAFKKLDARHWVLRTQLPLCRAMQAAIDEFNRCKALDTSSADDESVESAVEQLQDVVSGVEQVGLEKGSPKWLSELGGAALYDQALGLLEAYEHKQRKLEEEKEQEEKKKEQAAQAASPTSTQEAVEEPAAGEGDAMSATLSRRRSRHLTGLDIAEQSQITTGLQRATDEYDVDALEDFLRRAVASNYANCFEAGANNIQEPILVAARNVFEKLQTEDFLLASFAEVEAAFEQLDPPNVMMRRLENLAKQMRKMPGLEEQSAAAQTLLQRGVARRSVQKRKSSVFKSMDAEELNLANRTFGSLSEFAGLKAATSWSGHRQSLRKSSIKPVGDEKNQSQSMLNHSKVCIAESLLHAPNGTNPEDYEAAALQNFRNILVCMGDRPAQECQRHASFDAVVTLAKAGGSLCDEVYAQVMKQLTQNASTRSTHLGWELMQRLCQQAKPSVDFAEFVRVFFNKQVTSGEAANIPKTCLLELDKPVEQIAVVGESGELTRLSSENSRLTIENDIGRREIDRLTAENGQQAAEIARLQALVTSLQADICRLNSEPGRKDSTQVPPSNIEFAGNNVATLHTQAEVSGQIASKEVAVPVLGSVQDFQQDALATSTKPVESLPPEKPRDDFGRRGSGFMPSPPPVRRDSGAMPSLPGFSAGPAFSAALFTTTVAASSPASFPSFGNVPGPSWESLTPPGASTDAAVGSSAPAAALSAPGSDSPAPTAKAAGKGKGTGPAPPPGKSAGPAHNADDPAQEAQATKKEQGEEATSQPEKAEVSAPDSASPALTAKAAGKGKGKGPAPPPGKGGGPAPKPDDPAPEAQATKKEHGEEAASQPEKAQGSAPDSDSPAATTKAAGKGKGKGPAPPPGKGGGLAPKPDDPAPEAQAAEKEQGEETTLQPEKAGGSAPDSASPAPTAKAAGKGKGKGPAPPPGKGVGPSPKPDDPAPEAKAAEKEQAEEITSQPEKAGGSAPDPGPAATAKAAGKGKGKGPAPPPGKGGGPAPKPDDTAPQAKAAEKEMAGELALEPEKTEVCTPDSDSPAPTAKSAGKGKSKGPAPPPGTGLDAAPSAASPTEKAADPDSPAPAPKAAGKGKGTGPSLPPGKGGLPAPDSSSPSPEAKAVGKGKGKGPAPPPGKDGDIAPSADSPTADPKAAEKGKGKGSSLLMPAKAKSMARSPSPNPRGNGNLAVLGVGEGGVEELWERLEDSTVTWALLRFQVGSGTYVRTKMISIHFNGEDTPPVARGRLNARMGEALRLLGETHASLEVKRKEDLSIDWLCERLKPVFTADEGEVSVSGLKEEYEKQLAQLASKKRRKSTRRKTLVCLTVKERAACKSLTSREAMTAVGDARGAFNWALLEPTLDLHNAGYGGLDEMKTWLQDDKVLFGVIRFTFGQSSGQCGSSSVPAIVKNVFIHWIGPSVSAVKRGQWNSKRQNAETEVKRVCVITFGREAHDKDDLEVGELISEIKRLAIVDETQGADDTAAGSISVEEYMASLEKERRRQIEAEEAELDGEEEEKLPDVQTAVKNVRELAGSVNWMLIGAVGT